MFFLSWAFMGLAFYDPSSSKRRWADSLFLAGCILASLSKESFIIALPGIAFLRLWLFKELHQWTWRQSLQRNLFIGITLCIFALSEILFITYVAPGPRGPGYAGLSGVSAQTLYSAAAELAVRGNAAALFILLMFAIALGFLWKKNYRSALIASFIFLVLMAVPSVLLHQESGFRNAYCLPAILGFSYPIIYFYRILLAGRPIWIRTIFLVFLVWLALPNLREAFNDCAESARQCANIRRVLDVVQAETVASDAILIAANPARHIEWGAAIKIMLELQRDRPNIFYYPIHKPKYNEYEKILMTDRNSLFNVYQGRVVQSQDLHRFKIIVVLPTMEFFFRAQSKSIFNIDSYKRVALGQFVIYLK